MIFVGDYVSSFQPDWSFSRRPSYDLKPSHSVLEITVLITVAFFMVVIFPATVAFCNRLNSIEIGEIERNDSLYSNRCEMISFDEMFASFRMISIDSLVEFWDRFDIDDELKGALREYFVFIDNDQETPSGRKINYYLTILFNILTLYQELEEDLAIYEERVKQTMQEVLSTFSDGCHYNQLSHLKTILSELMDAHPDLARHAGVQSPIDFIFALALHQYQISLIRDKIEEEALLQIRKAKELRGLTIIRLGCYYCVDGVGQLRGLGVQEVARRLGVAESDLASRGIQEIVGPSRGQINFLEAQRRIGQADVENFGLRALSLDSIRQEGVELEFVVMKELGLTQDRFQAHYFENNNPIVKRISLAVKKAYNPEDFFLRELTEPFVNPTLRKFHADIALWYRKNGLDPYENQDLLMNPAAKDYQLWFNINAIYCFMIQNEFIIPSIEDDI
jgi:hypothetical protein